MKRKFGNISRGTMALLCIGIGLLVCAVAVISLQVWPHSNNYEEIEWDLTLVGSEGQQVVLCFDDVLSLPSIQTSGGFFTSVGVIHGPYQVKGISIETLCNVVGGVTASDILFVAAEDGYSAVYDYDQLNGRVDTFEPDTVRYIPGGDAVFLLIYEQEGKPLTHDSGGPLRLAVASPDGLPTEGHWWVKWVNRIEIREPRAAAPG
ncbi:MAG: molybdopterin-dependent oxidoreductase [Dehalococcoidia bacterium]